MADNLFIEGLLDKSSTRQSLFEEMQNINLRDIDFLRICEIYNPLVPYFSNPISEEIIKSLDAENQQLITKMRFDSGINYAKRDNQELMKEVISHAKEIAELKNNIKQLVAMIEAQNAEIKMLR